MEEGENANMDAEEIRAIFKFSAMEKNMISSFGVQGDLFLPFLLSLKSGGSWSYATEETKSMAVKDVITYYDEESKAGYTLEKIYFLSIQKSHLKKESSAGWKNAGQKKKENLLKDLTQ